MLLSFCKNNFIIKMLVAISKDFSIDLNKNMITLNRREMNRILMYKHVTSVIKLLKINKIFIKQIFFYTEYLSKHNMVNI